MRLPPARAAPATTALAKDLAARARDDSVTTVRRADAERLAREHAAQLSLARAAVADILAAPTHFGFDRGEIRAVERAWLGRYV